MSEYISPYSSSKTAKAVRKGISGQPQALTKGGEYAYGTITFADDPTAADTITLNGIWIEFSASATDFGTAGTEADPFILQVTGTLATTLTNLATALNGSANASLAVATYDGSSGTYLAITYDTFGSTGNAYTLVSSADTVSGATLTGGDSVRAISLTTENTDVQLSDSRDQYMTLADGLEFQKKVVAVTAISTGNLILTPDNYTDGTTITFDADGEVWMGIFINGSWKTIMTTATEA